MDAILTAIITAVVGASITIGMTIYLKIKKKEEAQRQKNYSNKINESWDILYKDIESSFIKKTVSYNNTALNVLIKQYLSILEPSWRNLLVHSPAYPVKIDEMDSQVNKRFDELNKRMEEIENRFPKEATLEKIASINDAILATNLEALSESIKKIENKLLTKFDVVKIFFQILTAIGVLTGIIFAILRYIAR